MISLSTIASATTVATRSILLSRRLELTLVRGLEAPNFMEKNRRRNVFTRDNNSLSIDRRAAFAAGSNGRAPSLPPKKWIQLLAPVAQCSRACF